MATLIATYGDLGASAKVEAIKTKSSSFHSITLRFRLAPLAKFSLRLLVYSLNDPGG